ncbi:MAG: methyltransferase domain-containing protein [Armatimonadetes bacterium]|nr:methyltransferase domain-containing protein [Armatimonadota bacterium]
MTDAPGRYLSFDAVAEDYDRTRVIPPAILDDVVRACAREARLSRGGLFLDAGVGTGRFAAPLAHLHPGRVVGLDISTAMMAQASEKAPPGGLSLIAGDLQRLPLRGGVFAGALIVHILHLVERWRLVLDELQRVLVPKTGVLLLGGDQGGRSALVDLYFERARARGVLGHSLGTPGLTQALAYLRRDARARVEMLSLPYLKWKRAVPVAETLAALERRTYSQIWDVPDSAHQALLAETQEYARRTLGGLNAAETLDTRFILYAARWP